MGDYPQAQNQGQAPAFRRGLLQALLGLGTGGTDQDPENRIEGDPATRANQDLTPVGQSASQRPATGTTSDLEDQVAAGRPSLAAQMSAPAETPAPDHLAQLQSQYDRLNPTPQPVSLKQKLLRGLAGAATGFLGGPQAVQGVEKQREFQQNQRREQSQNLLSNIEAERRMQEQEQLGTQRMTMQQDMENQREREREAAQERLFTQQNQLEGTREAARQTTLKQQMDEQNQRQQAQFQQQTAQQSRQFGEQEKLEGMRESAADRRAQDKKDQLTPATQGILQTTAPVKEQVQQLLKSLDDYIAQKPGNDKNRLTWDRAKYAMGMESPEGDIADQISKLEMDRVMAGARVLKGSSRAYQALELAMKHAPNPWTDQVGLMRQKLQNIQQNLDDVEKDAVRYGVKGQTAQDVLGTVPPGSAPPKAAGKTQRAKLKDQVPPRVLVEGKDF